MKKTIAKTCFDCGSKLILISKVTQKLEGSRFTQTICEYRCTNKACQDKKDKDKETRLKLAKEKEKADKKRNKNKIATRKNISFKKITR